MTSPDSVGRFKLLSYLFPGTPPGPDAGEAERVRWQEWLRSGAPLKAALNRAIGLENEFAALRAKAQAWDALAKVADHSAVSNVELNGDMPGPAKWIAIANLLNGEFCEGLQAETPEQAVANLEERFTEWHRDTFESCLEDG